jgi:uncharacterized protein YlaN (UPF0358 family)
MSYSITVDVKEHHLHVLVRGKNDAATIRRYIKDALAAAIAHSCPHVLIEENLDGQKLGMGDVFHIVAEACAAAKHDVHRIAFVDTNPSHGTSNMKFAETVALNRGMMMNAFSRVVDAEKWLTSKVASPAQAPKRPPKD